MEIHFTDNVDLEELRTRLGKMSDQELLRFGKDAKYMCSPWANMGKPPRQVFVIQPGRGACGMAETASYL